MAKKRQPDFAPPLHKTLSRPSIFLMRMLVFLALIGFIAAIASPMLKTAFLTNPFLNGLIVAVLFFGVLFSFRQVLRLYPEIKWVNAFRVADPGLAAGNQPTLLAPMATMLRERTGTLSLSTNAMRTIMDSIGSRLDEARDTGRYLVGLLVFLGLLGTFWGLLETIQSVGTTIQSLDTKASDAGVIFDDLKSGLSAPLKGMGTAFSASLIGLSGSLVLGFLELQASHAHNRFYNELEEWLSGITDLTPAAAASGDQLNRQLYGALLDVQRGITELSERIGSGAGTGPREDSMRDLAASVGQLANQMRQEQQVLRQWVDEQAAQNHEVAGLLKELSSRLGGKRV
jgi:hypothetical protein